MEDCPARVGEGGIVQPDHGGVPLGFEGGQCGGDGPVLRVTLASGSRVSGVNESGMPGAVGLSGPAGPSRAPGEHGPSEGFSFPRYDIPLTRAAHPGNG